MNQKNNVPGQLDHTGTSQVTKPFSVGGVAFSAVRMMRPRPHWRLQVDELGETFEAGASGISTESVPKMVADVEELFSRASKGDVKDFRRRLGLSGDGARTELKGPEKVEQGFAVAARRSADEDIGLLSFHSSQAEAIQMMNESSDARILSVVPATVHFAANGNVRLWHALGKPVAERKMQDVQVCRFEIGQRVYVTDAAPFVEGWYVVHRAETVSGQIETPDTIVTLCPPDNAPGDYVRVMASQLRESAPVVAAEKVAAAALSDAEWGRFENAGYSAIQRLGSDLGIEGDHDTKVRNLLISLQAYCVTYAVDLEAQLVEVRRQIASGDLQSPRWGDWVKTA